MARLAVLAERVGWPGRDEEGKMRQQEPAEPGIREVAKDHRGCSGTAEVRLAAEWQCGQICVAELNLEG